MWLEKSKQSNNSFLFKDFHHHQPSSICTATMDLLSEHLPQPTEDTYLDLLQNVFHHENFGGIQRKVVSKIAANKDKWRKVNMLLGSRSSSKWIDSGYHSINGTDE